MKKSVGMLTLLLLSAACANVMKTKQTLETLEHGVIRLHVRAASDSLADQTQKLMVRDAILAHADEWMPEQADYDTCCAALTDAMPAILQTAEDTLRAAGCTEPVSATLCEEAFPARSYGNVTLPAGNYQALCIEIGSGEGQNWWCVMYPGLCLPAAEEETVIADSFDSDVYALTTEPARFEVRLKCVELWRAVAGKCRGMLSFLTAKG